MNLQGRNLKLDMSGADVALLHTELQKLGYTIPEQERAQNYFGEGTLAAVKDFQKQHNLQPNGSVAQKTAKAINKAVEAIQPRFLVRGHVLHADGTPVARAIVKAFDKDLRSEELLGKTDTDKAGHYEIAYTTKKFRRAEKASADLVVRAYNKQGLELASSAILFNASEVAEVNLVMGNQLYRGPSEYQQLLSDLTPVLHGLSPADITEDDEHQDLTFLTGETGQERQRIFFLAEAHRLMRDTQIPAEAFYAFFRQNLPTVLSALLAQSPEIQHRALEVSIKENVISESFKEQIDAILRRLRQLIVDYTFKPPDEPGRYSLGDLLATTLPSQTKQQDFLTIYVNHTGPISEFWASLRENLDFRDQVDDLQFTLQVGALTWNHLPLVQEIQRMHTAQEITSFKDLVRFDVEEWKIILNKPSGNGIIGFPTGVPGEDDGERISNFATAMTHLMEDTFPTTAIAYRVENDNIAGKQDLLTFFARNVHAPDGAFDIVTTYLEQYLQENPQALDGVQDIQGTKQRIKTMQRLYKLAPRYAHFSVLMKDGIDSAYRMTRMSRMAFARKYGERLGGAAQAKMIYEKASQTHYTALHLMAEFGQMFHQTPMAVLPYTPPAEEGGNPEMTQRATMVTVLDSPLAAVDAIPDWKTLFGSLDLCECEHCRSVYSPAAYFVDLLFFLKERGSKIPGESAKDILFRRRSDLGEIELTCENTNTPVLYVDLVNEVLENAVSPFAPFVPFTLAPAREVDLENRVLSNDLKNAFTPALSGHAVISVKESGERWTIADTAYTYNIRKEGGALKVISRSRQTAGTSQELSANPQYINEAAYDKLRGEIYPWILPLDLWLEEARTYLGHLSVSRHELMQTFLKSADPFDPTDPTIVAIACEHLGLTTVERQIITGRTLMPLRNPWEFWGLQEHNNPIPDLNDPSIILSVDWLVALQRVRQLLDRSGLSYQELVDLLQTGFINPNNQITIISGDVSDPATCDSEKLLLTNLTEMAVSRLHRFVRLWRKLDWKIYELDKAITALQGAIADINQRLNDTFLVRLSHLKTAKSILKLSLEQVLTFWNAIDIDGEDSLHQRLFQNPAVIKPVDEDFRLAGAELAIAVATHPHHANAKISTHKAAILAALGIREADLAVLTSPIDPVLKTGLDATDLAVLNAIEVSDDNLNLANLSRLYRIAMLAKALKWSVKDTHTLIQLTLLIPFDGAHTENTLRFLEVAGKIRQARFSVAELDYLLRHHDTTPPTIALDEKSIALVLDEIRGGLQKIAVEQAFGPDTIDITGELTGQKLALLSWDATLVGTVITTFNNMMAYTISSVPVVFTGEFDFPVDLKGKIIYDRTYDNTTDETTIILRGFRGVMTLNEQTQLLIFAPDLAYQTAINSLFEAPRTFVSRNMKSFKVQTYVASLATLPAGIVFPEELRSKIYYDHATHELRFVGAMNEAEQTALLDADPDPDPATAYKAAIDFLFTAPDGFVPASEEAFITAADAVALFATFEPPISPDLPKEPKDRFKMLLEKLSAYLRQTLSENLVKHKLGEALKVETSVIEALLIQWVNSPTHPAQKCIAEFLAPAFAESHLSVTLTAMAFPDQFKTYELLHKIATLIAQFKSSHRQLRWVFEYGPGVSWLDLNTLPVELTALSSSLFRAFERLLDLFRLRDNLPSGETVLEDIFSLARNVATTEANLLQKLNTHTGWELESLQFLDGASGFNFAFPNAYRDEQALLRLHDCFKMLKRLGVSAVQSLAWSKTDLTAGDARSIRQAAKAKYDEEQWLTLAKPLRDVLREKQRAALVAYLIAHLQLPLPIYESPHPVLSEGARRPAVIELQRKLNAAGAHPPLAVDGIFGSPTRNAVTTFQRNHALTPNGTVDASTWAALDAVRIRYRDANDLYAHFLLDVEMSPCLMTSRIKQAISSSQLFVQRCLMNLEADVAADAVTDPAWRWWKWMKNYRVWEANRKIFCYPENWIEPELRDEKSTFFKEMENELLQNDLTEETAETAFLHYLEKLDAVARLEIVGIYHQVETHNGLPTGNVLVDILHVFGRTRGTPSIYYYRQYHTFNENVGYWTAWEKVDVDIKDDHLIPVIWNRRLYLFWSIFTDKQSEQSITMPTEDRPLTPGRKYWEIQLEWSEYKNKKWLAKKIASLGTFGAGAIGSLYTDTFDKKQFIFKVLSTSPILQIRLYFWLTLSGDKVAMPINVDFILHDCNNTVNLESLDAEDRSHIVLEPTGCKGENMMFVEDSDSGNRLILFEGNFSGTEDQTEAQTLKKDIPVLNSTPSVFRLIAAHQDPQFASQRPFFFQDDAKTFFVIPKEVKVPMGSWSGDAYLEPGLIGTFSTPYLEKAMSLPFDPSLINLFDPSSDDPSFAAEIGSGNGIFPGNGPVPGMPTPGRGMAIGNPVGLASRAIAITHGGTEMATFALRNGFGGFGVGAGIGRFTPILTYRTEKRYLFRTFYHPYVCEFIRQLNRDGIDGLLRRSVQLLHSPHPPGEFLLNPHLPDELPPSHPTEDFFETDYDPTPIVSERHPREEVDFSFGGAYSLYNWELFFHMPLLIADRLSKNQRFEEAWKWFHYIFDPTDSSAYPVPQRYWRTRKFFETTRPDYLAQQIQNILKQLADGMADPELLAQIADWRNNPFKPHRIARLRTTAYQKTVVMKYLDNLIAWGDQLFRRDTIESLNEATQLYILAAEILGRRPECIPPRAMPQVQTYNSLEPFLDAAEETLGNALVPIENFIPPSAAGTLSPGDTPPLTLPGMMLYFCVPKNDKLMKYWDIVADRLFKIRHCMNIEGVVRQLPLFEPPIDPALLVKAAAAGIDISSALNDINAALPHYRFNIMVQKAAELCAEVRSLGAALLSALEKRDAEALALMRSTHEINLLAQVRHIKERQIEEANESWEGLKKSKAVIQTRHDYYANLQFMNIGEQTQLALSKQSLTLQEVKSGMDLVANTLFLVPDIKTGSPTTLGATFGGQFIANAMRAYSTYMGELSGILNQTGSMAATLGGYQRRTEEWDFQKRLAAHELEQIDRQIVAAEIRLKIAEQDLKNHDQQIENAKEVDAYMREKFTNQELYDWMVGQISAIYFQSYQLAYDVAKRAEKTFRHELGLTDSGFIQFGYWDSLKKGLLAGDKLYHDLKRMEMAYMDQNKREYELTKSISLAMLDPLALINLKETGECFVNLPEKIFDLDYAGHYFRRIKNVRLTIPCVTGPHTTVNCTLTLLRNSIRTDPSTSGDYKRDESADDSRFRDNIGAIQSIATSSGQNDSGMFELNFRDERYLPFEGAGAISSWRIELTKDRDLRQFDYDTITDVIVHVSYTAREGGGQLKKAASTLLKQNLEQGLLALAESRQGLYHFFSAKHEFSGAWHRFLHPAGEATTQSLKLDLTKERFPFLVRNKTIELHEVEFFFKLKDEFAEEYSDAIRYPGGVSLIFTFKKESRPAIGTTAATYDPIISDLELLRPPDSAENYLHKKHDFGAGLQSLGKWFIEMAETNISGLPNSPSHPLKITVNINGVDHTRLNPEAYEDMFVVFRYSIA